MTKELIEVVNNDGMAALHELCIKTRSGCKEAQSTDLLTTASTTHLPILPISLRSIRIVDN